MVYKITHLGFPYTTTMHDARVAKKPYQECVVSVRIKRRKERKYEFDNNVI